MISMIDKQINRYKDLALDRLINKFKERKKKKIKMKNKLTENE